MNLYFLKTYIDFYLCDEILFTNFFKLSILPHYYLPRDGPMKSYKDFIQALPSSDHPETFGQHSNADIASQIQQSKGFFEDLLIVLPQKTSAIEEKKIENEVRA